MLLWRGFTLDGIMAQVFRNHENSGKGRQIAVHYGSKQHHPHTISSPLATQIPQAAGVGFVLKRDPERRSNNVACVFFGEGAASGTSMLECSLLRRCLRQYCSWRRQRVCYQHPELATILQRWYQCKRPRLWYGYGSCRRKRRTRGNERCQGGAKVVLGRWKGSSSGDDDLHGWSSLDIGRHISLGSARKSKTEKRTTNPSRDSAYSNPGDAGTRRMRRSSRPV